MGLRGRFFLLSNDRAQALQEEPLTYDGPGATKDAARVPRFFLPLEGSRRIGSGEACFRRASAAVLAWEAQRSAWIDIHASAAVVAEGVVADQRIGPISAPCRVVYVLDEPRRKGFAYGTLPGHPERGEERFAVTWDPQTDEVRAEVSSVSLPAALWLLALPFLRVAQVFFVWRFLAGIERAARQDGIGQD